MNWENLRQTCPHSIAAMLDWLCGEQRCAESKFDRAAGIYVPKNLRSLYDFFDERTLFVEVGRAWDGTNRWCWSVRGENVIKDDLKMHEKTVESRQEAENAAFVAAFELLETELQAKGGSE